MRTCKLHNLKVSAVGMGCMGFSHGYGALPAESESIRLMQKAFDLGCTHYDTAEAYGPYLNEELVGRAIKPFRNKIVLATKFVPGTLAGQENWGFPKMSRQGIRKALEDSLRRLQTDYIDIYYQHRVPLDSNPEEVAYWMGELIQEGKIRGWGQSQSTETQLRKAHAVTPLTAIQSEYSMMERMFEKDVIPACRELGIGFVAFSPMASGFLSGKYDESSVYKGDDVRLAITRFYKENVIANMPLLAMLKLFAARKNATMAQIALAWMMHDNDFITPIPGMRSDARIEENLGAADVTFTDDEYAALQDALDKISIHGNRTDEDIIAMGHVKTHD